MESLTKTLEVYSGAKGFTSRQHKTCAAALSELVRLELAEAWQENEHAVVVTFLRGCQHWVFATLGRNSAVPLSSALLLWRGGGCCRRSRGRWWRGGG